MENRTNLPIPYAVELENRIAELEAENAKLRDALESAGLVIDAGAPEAAVESWYALYGELMGVGTDGQE